MLVVQMEPWSICKQIFLTIITLGLIEWKHLDGHVRDEVVADDLDEIVDEDLVDDQVADEADEDEVDDYLWIIVQMVIIPVVIMMEVVEISKQNLLMMRQMMNHLQIQIAQMGDQTNL